MGPDSIRHYGPAHVVSEERLDRRAEHDALDAAAFDERRNHLLELPSGERVRRVVD